MKLTKTKLKQIIKEELNKVLNEAPSRDPGGFMGMHIGGGGPVDTSGIDLSEPSFEQTLADKAIAALEEDEAANYDWVVDMLTNLEGEQENDRDAIERILWDQIGIKLEELGLRKEEDYDEHGKLVNPEV
jgi:hypothetical protein